MHILCSSVLSNLYNSNNMQIVCIPYCMHTVFICMYNSNNLQIVCIPYCTIFVCMHTAEFKIYFRFAKHSVRKTEGTVTVQCMNTVFKTCFLLNKEYLPNIHCFVLIIVAALITKYSILS